MAKAAAGFALKTLMDEHDESGRIRPDESHSRQRGPGSEPEAGFQLYVLQTLLKSLHFFNLVPVSAMTLHMFKRRRAREALWI